MDLRGRFSSTYTERAHRADTIIFMDVGLARRLWRVTYRFFRYFGQSRPDLPEGCNEGNWREMWDFYKWIWNTRHTARTKAQRLLKDHPDTTTVTLTSIPETNTYLERIHA